MFFVKYNVMQRYYFPCTRYVDEVPFLMLWDSNEDAKIVFGDWWRIFNDFLSTCAVYFPTTHTQNKTHRFDTEGFVQVINLWGVVGSSFWFTKYLIVKIGNICSVVYNNAKCIHSSETRSYAIIGCAIISNVHHW